MNLRFRFATAGFSLFLHGAIIATGFLFSGASSPLEEKIYRVSLAEFAPASVAQPVAENVTTVPQEPVAPEIPPPATTPEPTPIPTPQKPVPVPTPPKPTPHPQPRPETPPVKPVERKPAQTYTPPRPPEAQQRSTSHATANQPSGEATRGGPRTIGGMSAYTEDIVDQRPSISRRVMPQYPDNARRRNVEGEVVVQLVVDVSGRPQQCTIYSSKPEGVFDRAALVAAEKTSFVPGKVNGQPVNTIVLIPYKFALR